MVGGTCKGSLYGWLVVLLLWVVGDACKGSFYGLLVVHVRAPCVGGACGREGEGKSWEPSLVL